MDMSVRNGAIRAPEIETATTTDAASPADVRPFGDLLEEVRQRDGASGDEQPEPGSEVATASPQLPPAQPVPPARQEDPDAGAGESATAVDNPAAGPAGGATVPDATADTLSPGRFLALLDSAVAAAPAAAMQLPAGDAAVLAPAVSTVPLPADPPPPLPATMVAVEHPLRSPEWPAAFGNTVRLLVGEQAQVARIRLNPEDLGPVDVRIKVSDNRAEIAFAVSSPEARAAIQQALPQLRETLAGSGLQLGDATFGQAGADSGSGYGTPAGNETGPDPAAGVPLQTAARPAATGLVDLYA